MRVLSVSEADKRNGGSEVTEKGEERRGCVDGILAEGGGSEEDAVFDDGEGREGDRGSRSDGRGRQKRAVESVLVVCSRALSGEWVLVVFVTV